MLFFLQVIYVVNVYQEFISAGVNAYALGCTDDGLRKELTAMKESGVKIEAMQSYGGGTSLKSKIFSEEVIHSYFNLIYSWWTEIPSFLNLMQIEIVKFLF